ncbi:MAG: hypothetical protein M1275_01990 [Patescibacteria group bacterium]|nr:hypothetical protein [Patescibacteria group bacterium]
MTEDTIRLLKKAATAHLALAVIALLAVACFSGLWALAEFKVVSELFFRKAFVWLFLVFVPAAVLNAALTLYWMLPVLWWRPGNGRVTVWRRGLLEIYLSM